MYTFEIFLTIYLWLVLLIQNSCLFFPTLSYSLLQDKHKAWEREDNPVKGSSIMKNFPSSLSVIARIRCLDLWLCRLRKSKTDCSSSGAAEMVELRCAFQVIQSFREKRKRRLTTCGLIPDSCQIPLTNVRYFRILSTCSNVVGVFSVPMFHIVPYSFRFVATDFIISYFAKAGTAIGCKKWHWITCRLQSDYFREQWQHSIEW